MLCVIANCHDFKYGFLWRVKKVHNKTDVFLKRDYEEEEENVKLPSVGCVEFVIANAITSKNAPFGSAVTCTCCTNAHMACQNFNIVR